MFVFGFFCESCGVHFYCGVDVKLFYIKKFVDNFFVLMLILNRLWGWGVVGGMSDLRFYKVWVWFFSQVFLMFFGGMDFVVDYYVVSLFMVVLVYIKILYGWLFVDICILGFCLVCIV